MQRNYSEEALLELVAPRPKQWCPRAEAGRGEETRGCKHTRGEHEDGGQPENTFSKCYKYQRTALKSQDNRLHIKAKCMGNRTIKYSTKANVIHFCTRKEILTSQRKAQAL